MTTEIRELIEKYNEGRATGQEVEQIESYIEQGVIKTEDLSGLNVMQMKLDSIATPEPAESMSSDFYQKLSEQKKKTRSHSWTDWLVMNWKEKPAFQWAYTIAILAIGLLSGYLLRPDASSNNEIKQLSAEVTEMKEMMMLSLLEKESTSDRLKAVNLTSELPDASKKITEALIKTLNNDENVNVRLATIEALYPYANNPKVRQGLIKSISRQESPLVQIALAEMMVTLQEKGSVNELEQILKKEQTPDEVKERIKESIAVLI